MAHPALVDGGAEAGQVADHAAADRHHEVRALGAGLGQRAQHRFGLSERLALLARRHHRAAVAVDLLERRDVLVGHHVAPSAERREEARLDQPAAEEHGIVAGLRRGPHEACARGGLPQRGQERQRAAQRVAVAGRHHPVGHRLVEGHPVAVQLREAGPVAGQGPPPARGPAPGALGIDLQVHHGVAAERLADALGLHGAAAERDHRSVAAGQQLADDLLLALAEGLLPAAVEEALDRLAQRELELAVGIDRARSQLGRQRTRAGRLAGAHEADEDERAVYARVHPIRSV